MILGIAMVGISEASRKELHKLVEEYELREYTDVIEAATEGYMYLTVSGRDNYGTIGNTRIGGVPDLPPTITWPKSERGYYSFVAQINLAELPQLLDSPLPKRGILYFFFGYYPNTIRDHKIFYFDGDTETLNRAIQPSLEEFSSNSSWPVYEPCLVTIKDSFALPQRLDGEHDLFASVIGINEPDFRLWINKRYFQLLREMNIRRRGFVKYDSEVSQLLGQPSMLHGDNLTLNAQLVREGKSPYSFDEKRPNENESKKWVLLLELGSHDLARMQWSDVGFLDFVIHTDDLERLDFTRTYCAIASA